MYRWVIANVVCPARHWMVCGGSPRTATHRHVRKRRIAKPVEFHRGPVLVRRHPEQPPALPCFLLEELQQREERWLDVDVAPKRCEPSRRRVRRVTASATR
jgi:hypothetical protein